MGDACLCKMRCPAPALPAASASPASLAEPAQAPAGLPSTEAPKSKVGEQRKVEEPERKLKEGARKSKEDGKKVKEGKGEDTGRHSRSSLHTFLHVCVHLSQGSSSLDLSPPL